MSTQTKMQPFDDNEDDWDQEYEDWLDYQDWLTQSWD
jgi:hypothetical protein